MTGGTLEDLEITKVAPSSAKLIRFGDNAATLSAFKSGQIDVLVTGTTAAAGISAEDSNLDIQTKFIIKASPSISKGPSAWIWRIASSLMLPATMPEKMRLRFAVISCAGIFGSSFNSRMFW